MRIGALTFALSAVIIFTCLLLNQSCKDCRKSDVGYFTPNEMYKYIFRDTSTWIYLNTTDSTYDTVMLHSLREVAEPLDFGDADCPQKVCMAYYMNMHSSYTNSEYTFCVKDSGLREITTGLLGWPGTEIFHFFKDVGDSTSSVRYVAYYTGLNIAGNLTYFIKKVELMQATSTFPVHTYLYWAPQTGIVRKEIVDSNGSIIVWNLVQEKITYY